MEQVDTDLRVLVVDDNVDAADLVAEFMAFQGYEVAG
jgi:DNA-binding response OmpR family regulator